MKNFLLIFFLAIGLTTINGCQPVKAQSPITVSKAANTNADTSYLTLKMVPFFDQMSIQAIVTRNSGSLGGYIIPQYSNDGANYINSTDSLVLTNVATQTKIWTYTGNNYLYYRYRFISSGTQTSALKGYYITRTRPN